MASEKEESVCASDSEVISTRSGLEREILEDLVFKDVTFDYESLKLKWHSEHIYTPDFVITTRSRKKIVIEAKGFFRPSDRMKIRAIKEQHPDIDLRFVFENPHRTISKKSSTTYARWCEKKDIPWARYKVPQEWLDE